MPTPVRVFIGTEPKTRLAEMVLRYSIVTRTSAEVEFTPLIGNKFEVPEPLASLQKTGFSFRRFLVPGACNFEGRAIYLDADQLVLGDLQELWDYGDGDGSVFLTYQDDALFKDAPQTSVMVLNCDRCQWDTDFLWRTFKKRGYQDSMHGRWMDPPAVKIPTAWNHFNHKDDTTKLVHYTIQSTQPWYKPGHPLAGLWRTELERALDAGAVERSVIEHAVKHHGVHKEWLK